MHRMNWIMENWKSLNDVLITEPFQLNENSKIVFSEKSGFVDSVEAAKNLGKDGFVNYKLELIDHATGKVIAQIKNENLNSANARSIRAPAYSLNANGASRQNCKNKNLTGN